MTKWIVLSAPDSSTLTLWRAFAAFVAGVVETLSMEVPTPSATPSLTAPLCSQDFETPINGRTRCPLLIHVLA